ncbi:MAG: hypothetical protein HY321_14955 [Armatimonadetes bacterium]|nr:hypothetical protein [Armatimonadota bacterium]
MSLGIVIKGPEGLVLAAESRVTVTAQFPNSPPIHVSYDNAVKVLKFGDHPNVGAVTYGLAAIDGRTAHSFMPELEAWLPKRREDDDPIRVQDFAVQMSAFFMKQWEAAAQALPSSANMAFVVGGFDKDESYGKVFLFQIPAEPIPTPRNDRDKEFGITWGGQREVVDRLLMGYDPKLPGLLEQALGLNPGQRDAMATALKGLQMPVPINMMALQDCVDLAILYIRTTIAAQQLQIGVRGCGGPIDVATITRREGFRWIQQKEVVGEFRRAH